MSAAIRSYRTAGVALVGAGIIGVAAIMPATIPTATHGGAPTVQVAEIHLAAKARFEDFFTKTVANIQDRVATVPIERLLPGFDPDKAAAAITPINQIIANTDSSATRITDSLFSEGDLSSTSVFTAISALLDEVNTTIQKFTTTTNVLLDPVTLAVMTVGLISPLISGITATIHGVQAIFDPTDGTGFAKDLFKLGPTIMDGLLTGGYGSIVEIPIEVPNPIPFLPPLTVTVAIQPGGVLSPLSIDVDPSSMTVTIVTPGPIGTAILIRKGLTRIFDTENNDSIRSGKNRSATTRSAPTEQIAPRIRSNDSSRTPPTTAVRSTLSALMNNAVIDGRLSGTSDMRFHPRHTDESNRRGQLSVAREERQQSKRR